MHIHPVQQLTLTLTNTLAGIKKYPYGGEMDAESMSAFVQDFLDGNIENTLKSQPVSKSIHAISGCFVDDNENGDIFVRDHFWILDPDSFPPPRPSITFHYLHDRISSSHLSIPLCMDLYPYFCFGFSPLLFSHHHAPPFLLPPLFLSSSSSFLIPHPSHLSPSHLHPSQYEFFNLTPGLARRHYRSRYHCKGKFFR